MERVLLTAPWVGEIGWELMAWQGRVRWTFSQDRYHRVVVLGTAGRAGFYGGMPLDYQTVDLDYLPGAAYEDRRIITASGEPISAERLRQCVAGIVGRATARYRQAGFDVDVLWPHYAGKVWPCDPDHQHFIRYRKGIEVHDSRRDQRPSPVAGARPWVVLIERTRAYRGGQNWSTGNWNELARELTRRGVHTSVYPADADAAIAMLSGADLAVGQSTGGLHLAALCGCPALVWSLQRYLMWEWEITNRQRYETWWNPLGSPVIVRELAQLPAVEQAADEVMAALRTIGRRTSSRWGKIAFRGKWFVRDAVRRRIIEPRRYANWPWPVQKFVRYQLA